MALSRETVQKALLLKEQAVKKEEYRYEKALEKAKAENRRIPEIDTALANIGAALLGHAMRGETDAIEECRAKSEELSKENADLLREAGVECSFINTDTEAENNL